MALGFEAFLDAPAQPHVQQVTCNRQQGAALCVAAGSQPYEPARSRPLVPCAPRASIGDLDTIFAQRSNLLSPTFLRMVYDVIRFGREAPKVRTPCSGSAVWGLLRGCRG